MISSFWNLCRSCPSVPVDKLHSEYRSTFQWHEYVGSTPADNITSFTKNNTGSKLRHQQNHVVVRQPTTLPSKGFWSGQGGEERRGKRVIIDNINTRPATNGWWVAGTGKSNPITSSAQTRKGHSKTETQLPSEESGGGPTKSLSMGTIRAFESGPLVETHVATQNNNVGAMNDSVEQRGGTMAIQGPESLEWSANNMSSSYEGPGQSRRKEYKSEYKKQFRPFSQYEYVDGRFMKKKGEQQHFGDPWYKEVIELRQKAGEYRYRGWGTELVPQHLAEAYQHSSVWDQVSRRSSLAALALITTTKTSLRDEKDKENASKSLPKRSLSRPNTATPKHPISDFKLKDSEPVHGAKKRYEGPPSAVGARASRGKSRSQSAGPGARSPRKSTTHHSVLAKDQREILDPNRPRHPRPSSADPSLGFSEPVIKSPPEPTRVKSPDQKVILKSPDPQNWTVPLDTTRSFTVTQNIREAPPSPRFRAGDRLDSSRSGGGGSSTKASSPLSTSSRSAKPTGQSQPPQSVNKTPTQQQRPGSGGNKERPVSAVERKPVKPSGNLNGEPTTVTKPSQRLDNRKPEDTANNNDKKPPPTTTTKPNTNARPDNATFPKKPVPGTTLQCLEDPQFMFDPPKTTVAQQSKPASAPITATHKTPGVTSPPSSAPPKGGIRVLEAPGTEKGGLGFVPPAPVTAQPKNVQSPPQQQPPKLPSYKVLDAPDIPSEMTTSMIVTTSPTSKGSIPPTTTTASASSKDAGGKSKHKFDFKFWKKDGEK